MRFPLRGQFWPAFLLLLLLAMGCDIAPGPAATSERPPLLSDLVYTPEGVVIEELPPSQVIGEEVQIPITFSVQASDPDGDLAEVRYVIQAPRAGADLVAEGLLGRASNGRFDAAITLTVPKAEVGLYTLLLYAVDHAGQLSNQVRGLFRLDATGAPPVIEDVEVPATVTRPAEGEPAVLIEIVATVSDPDGLANIQRVEMRAEGSATTFQLCDDGGGVACGAGSDSGDAVAGDGRFTITVRLESTNTPGDITFLFQAFDRGGLESDIVARTITVE